jgi:hypothetical protein
MVADAAFHVSGVNVANRRRHPTFSMLVVTARAALEE